jgi:uncharacterized damage-inducible protein DinB
MNDHGGPLPEHWLRGPVDGIPGPLQPVAHALLQARDEARELMLDFPDDLLWSRPAGVAPIGFHLRHIAGVVDRLFTYARGESLTPEQREQLTSEGFARGTRGEDLVLSLDRQVDRALDQLRGTDEQSLAHVRGVGRKQLPSTVLGLLFHAAEHAQRHVGQMLVTARVLRRSPDDG